MKLRTEEVKLKNGKISYITLVQYSVANAANRLNYEWLRIIYVMVFLCLFSAFTTSLRGWEWKFSLPDFSTNDGPGFNFQWVFISISLCFIADAVFFLLRPLYNTVFIRLFHRRSAAWRFSPLLNPLYNAFFIRVIIFVLHIFSTFGVVVFSIVDACANLAPRSICATSIFFVKFAQWLRLPTCRAYFFHDISPNRTNRHRFAFADLSKERHLYKTMAIHRQIKNALSLDKAIIP